jgi:hypothetical protein
VTGDVVLALLAVTGQVAADSGDDASQRLSMVIVGLLVLAAVIAVATVVFWRLTRPDPSAAEPAIRWVTAPEGVEPPAPLGAPSAAAPSTPTAGGDAPPTGTPPAAG